jgi:four helix bundle protein
MRNPERLQVTREARALAVSVYRLSARFPADERFGLTAQMRRAAVSIGSNIAEGCGRRGRKELLQFLYVASGSAGELAFQLTLAAELAFGRADERETAADRVDHVQRMLNRLTAQLGKDEERSRRRSTP